MEVRMPVLFTNRVESEKKLSSREDHVKKIMEMLDDIWLYHVERKMILNENECPRHDLR